MKNNISEIKLRQNKIDTVIEFSPYNIKLVQSLRKKDAITNIFVQEVRGNSEHEFINTLDKIIKNNHLKIGNLLISLDRSLSSVQFAKLPAAEEEEIKQMSRWQAAKILPCNVDEIIVSHKTVKSDNQDFFYVVLVVVPRNIVTKFINICSALKLIPQFITLSSEGLMQWHSKQKLNQNTDKALVVIDIDKNKTELIIIYENKLIFSRSLLLHSLQQDSLIKDIIAEELKLSLEFYKRQEVCPDINKIVLTGSSGYVSKLSTVINKAFNLPIEIIDHIKDSKFIKSISIGNIAFDISLASICGFIEGQKPIEINLMPQEVIEKTLYTDKKKEFFRTIYLILLFLLVFSGTIGFSFYDKKKIIKNLDRQILRTNAVAGEVQDIKNKIAIINKQINNQNSCLEVLREIHRIIPENIFLNTFIFEGSDEVILKGTASDMSLVFGFVPILNESSLLEKIELRYVTQRKIQSREFTDFEIICKLSFKGE